MPSERIEALFGQWKDTRDRGEVINPEDLTHDAGDLAELRTRIEREKRIQALLTRRDEAREQGQLLSPEDLTDDPSEREELWARIRVIDGVDAFRHRPHRFTLPPLTIPGYEIESVLGWGGMGRVYKARQESLDRVVALKVLLQERNTSPEQVERFCREATTAGELGHEHIVPVYDAGSHDGQLYLAMKYIEGGSLQGVLAGRPCDADPKVWQRWAAALIATVARAVQYAHDHGIIHRDIKPANILLESREASTTELTAPPPGKPYVADFGLARNVEPGGSVTASGTVLGTPQYMAPEQAEGDRTRVTIRTDVYGLGATLYEALTGLPPFQGENVLAILNQVVKAEPVRPREIDRRIDRDLETICLKCLEKNPGRRYPSAAALVDDLERWVRGEPIEARPAGPAERAWRWCLRNPLAAGLIAAILVGMSGIIWEWREAVWQRGQKDIALQDAVERKVQAEHARDGTRAINDYLNYRVIGVARPLGRGGIRRDVTLREALNAAVPHIAKDFQGQPELEASVRRMIGNTYFELGDYDAATVQLTNALELFRKTLGVEQGDTLVCQRDLAIVYMQQGKLAEAEGLFRPALTGLVEARGLTDPDAIKLRGMLGALLKLRGELAEAEGLLRESVELSRRSPGSVDGVVTLFLQGNLGEVLRERGKLAEAEELLRLTLEGFRAALGPEDINTLGVQCSLATVLSRRGQSAEAERLVRQVLEVRERILGPHHRDTLVAQEILAGSMGSQGNAAESERFARLFLDTSARVLGPDNPDTLRGQNGLAVALWLRGKPAEAEQLLRKTLDARLRTSGQLHPDTLTVQSNLGAVVIAGGRPAEAERLLRPALAAQQLVLGPTHPNTLTTQHNLASSLIGPAQRVEAEELLQRTLEGRRRVLGPDHPDTLSTQHNLAAVWANGGRLADAEQLLRKTLDASLRVLGADHPDTLKTQTSLAGTLGNQRKLAEAESLLRKTLESQYRVFGANHPNTLLTQQYLAVTSARLNHPEEAERLFRLTLNGWRRAFGATHPQSLETQLSLGITLIKKPDAGEGESLLREALQRCDKALPANHPLVYQARDRLSDHLVKQGRHDEAEPLLLANYEVVTRPPAGTDQQVNEVIDRLVSLYDAKGQKDKAAAWAGKRRQPMPQPRGANR